MLDYISSDDDYGWATDKVESTTSGAKEYGVMSPGEAFERCRRMVMHARRSPVPCFPHYYEMVGAHFTGGRSPTALFIDYDNKVPRYVSLAWRFGMLGETEHGGVSELDIISYALGIDWAWAST